MVLVAEDQTLTSLQIKTLLKRQGYNSVLCFREGADAMEYILNEDPDFAILDIMLDDDVSGLDIARKLKEKNISFIFVSAFSDPKYFREAKDLDPAEIISKPFDEYELINALNKLKLNLT